MYCGSARDGLWRSEVQPRRPDDAVNTLFRYPHRVKRCYGLSGVYDLKRFMDGQYDDNFYFHNPVDYVTNLHDGWTYEQLASCGLRDERRASLFRALR